MVNNLRFDVFCVEESQRKFKAYSLKDAHVNGQSQPKRENCDVREAKRKQTIFFRFKIEMKFL